jgi:acylphosphatase
MSAPLKDGQAFAKAFIRTYHRCSAPGFPLYCMSAGIVTEKLQAKLFLVSGMVQGVGYRYFAMHAAAEFGINGYVKNLDDGRVEVYGIGSPDALASFRAALVRGPHSAEVSGVEAEDRPVDNRYAANFSIEHDW